MSSFNWHPNSVPPPYDQFIDMIVKGLQDGSIFVRQVDTTYSIMGSQDFHVEFVGTPLAAKAMPPAASNPFFTSPLAYSWSSHTGPQVESKAKAGVADLGTGKEPIVGFRDFEIEEMDEGFILLSRNGAVWWPRQKLRARCTRTGSGHFSDHDAPKEDCACGIYAYSHPNDSHLKATDVVWGEIALWGDVLICESGYRAEFAYPLSLFVRDTGTKMVRHIRDSLEANYGVPVFLVDERDGKTAAEIMGELVAGMLLDRELENE